MRRINKLLIASVLSLFSIAVIGQSVPPSGYYNSASGLTGTALQSALHDIIDGHTVRSYNQLKSDMGTTDRRPDGTVWDMYSDNPNGPNPYNYNFTSSDQCGNYTNEGDCYNREHSFPKSWFNDASPMYTDLFHLYPTDGKVNGYRSNFVFGEVNGTISYTSQNGSKLGQMISPSLIINKVFEPIDEYKGDFARTYFYMATRYYGEDNSWNSNDAMNGAQPKAWALEMFLQWSADDPVSDKERDRNDAVYGIQHNRNPFIDSVEYIERIWGSPSQSVEDNSFDSQVEVFPNPSKTNLNININSDNINNYTVSIYDLAGREVYSKSYVDNNSININVDNLVKGSYIINIVSDNKWIAKKKFVKI